MPPGAFPTAVSACDDKYESGDGAQICTAIVADELPGLGYIWPLSGQSVTEGGIMSYQVRLNTVPNDTVSVGVTVEDEKVSVDGL